MRCPEEVLEVPLKMTLEGAGAGRPIWGRNGGVSMCVCMCEHARSTGQGLGGALCLRQRPGTSPDLSTPPWRKACLGPNKEGLSWPVPSEDTLYGLVTQHQWNFINSQPMSLFPTSGCDRGGEITWGK